MEIRQLAEITDGYLCYQLPLFTHPPFRAEETAETLVHFVLSQRNARLVAFFTTDLLWTSHQPRTHEMILIWILFSISLNGQWLLSWGGGGLGGWAERQGPNEHSTTIMNVVTVKIHCYDCCLTVWMAVPGGHTYVRKFTMSWDVRKQVTCSRWCLFWSHLERTGFIALVRLPVVWAYEKAAVQAKVDGIVEKEQWSAAEVAELINTDPNQVWPISQAERDSASEAAVWLSLGKGGEGRGKKSEKE